MHAKFFNASDAWLLSFLHTVIRPSELLTSFLGAIQASLSVLSYGVIAAQFDILKGDSTRQISTLYVRMFLPALLITNVGSQFHADTDIRYVPILSELQRVP